MNLGQKQGQIQCANCKAAIFDELNLVVISIEETNDSSKRPKTKILSMKIFRPVFFSSSFDSARKNSCSQPLVYGMDLQTHLLF